MAHRAVRFRAEFTQRTLVGRPTIPQMASRPWTSDWILPFDIGVWTFDFGHEKRDYGTGIVAGKKEKGSAQIGGLAG